MTRNEAILMGLKTYSTGMPCRRGHLSERYSSTGNCVACHNGRAFKVVRNAPAEITASIEAKRDAELSAVENEIGIIENLRQQLFTKKSGIIAKYQAQISAATAAYVIANQGNMEALLEAEKARAKASQILRTFTTGRVAILDQPRIDLMITKAVELAAARGVELPRDQAFVKSDSMFSYYRCHADDKLALVTYGNAMQTPVIQAPPLAANLSYLASLDAAADTTPPESNL